MSANIAFLIESNLQNGLGHLMRCRNLAIYLNNNAKIYFLIINNNNLEDEIFYRKKLKGFSLTFFKKNNDFVNQLIIKLKKFKIDELVIDIYNFNYKNEKKISNSIINITVIDDFPSRNYYCNKLICYTPNQNQKKFEKKNKNFNCKYFLGINYFINDYKQNYLRKSYIKNFQKKIKLNINHNSVLINLGGFDKKLNTLKLLNFFIQNNFFKNFKFYICVGSNILLLKKIEILIKQFKNIFIVSLNENLNKYYAKVDFVIGAGGISSYERVFFGVPSLNLALYNNQKLNVEIFKNLNLAIKLNIRKINDIIFSIKKLYKFQKKFHINSLMISDLNKNKFNKILFENKTNEELMFKIAQNKDMKYFYKIQNQKNSRDFFINNKAINYNDHKKWFYSKITDPNYCLFLITVDNMKIGIINLFINNNFEVEISILIDYEFRYRGYGTKAIRLINNNLYQYTKIAKVHFENVASSKMFKNNKFKLKTKKRKFLTFIYEV
tara:strand:- start:28545 stop:30029 length:1485 start_codon:yes stop_codon:yes gene_type:complete